MNKCLNTIVISLFLFVVSMHSFSQVVYYDMQPDLEITTGRFGPSKNIYCTLDEFGISDSIRFSISFASIPFGTLQFSMTSLNNMYVAASEDDTYEALNLEALSDIASDISFSSTNVWFALYCDNISCNYYEFQNVESGFIGFAYVENGDTLYGWLRLRTKTPDINNLYSLLVVDMAINQQNGCVMYAGEGIPPLAEYIIAQDVSDYRDERDIEIKFSNAINYAGISEYRVFIVPSDIADLFDMSTAQGVSEGNYFTVEQTDTIFLGNVPAGTKDCQGNEIQELISYKIFVMSIADGLNLTENFLSRPSNDLILTTSVHPVQNAAANSTYNGENSYTVDINFDAPEIINGILHYRVFLVDSSDIESLNTETFLQVLPENYIIVESDENNYSGSFDYSVLKDIYGNYLSHDKVYKVAILSVANMIDANESVIVFAGSELVFATPCSPVTMVNVYDSANSGNSSDIGVSFEIADETHILAYKIFVVKDELSDTFNNETANIAPDDNYYEIMPLGTNIYTSLPTNLMTSDGDIIYENVKYRIYVQSVADLISTDVNALSQPSYQLVLHNPDYFKAGQSYGDSVSYIDFEPDITLTRVDVPLNSEANIELFINNDDEPDAQIVMKHTPMWHGDRIDVYLKTLDNTEVCIIENQINSCMVMHEFQMIGPYNTWHSGDFEMAYEYHSWEGEGLGGSWHNLDNGYLALAKFSESDTIYAWYNISLDKAYSVTVNSYAKSICSSVLGLVYDKVTIFPNPTNSGVSLFLPNEMIGSEIKLFNIQGKLIISYFANANEIKISTSELNSGIYIIRIIGPEKSISYKLMVE
ncbi:MAG: T9SS type A sorting domain-containing protein [Bacteroidales bacterium]|nr:T9SS type A sorting domain-containing protein [Bacteroidales bacterium]